VHTLRTNSPLHWVYTTGTSGHNAVPTDASVHVAPIWELSSALKRSGPAWPGSPSAIPPLVRRTFALA